jgi:RNA polymerase sigma-70 factor (ECF subfamily)
LKDVDIHSDQELINGCLKNNRLAQERLYRKYFPMMTAMCNHYTRDEDEVLSIINDGFLKVFTKIETYSGTGSLVGWIRKIVFNCLSDYFKVKNRSIRFIMLEDQAKSMVESVHDNFYYDELLTLIHSIPDKHARVFELYAIEGMKHEEIGKLLGIKSGTSKWYLNQARNILKDKLTRLETINN